MISSIAQRRPTSNRLNAIRIGSHPSPHLQGRPFGNGPGFESIHRIEANREPRGEVLHLQCVLPEDDFGDPHNAAEFFFDILELCFTRHVSMSALDTPSTDLDAALREDPSRPTQV